MQSIEMAKILETSIKNITGMSDTDSRLMSLFVAGFAAINNEINRSMAYRMIVHCIMEITDFLSYDKLPEWFKTEVVKDPKIAKA